MKLRFIDKDGVVEADGRPGDRLLDAAQAAGLPLEGTCDGDMACATCHVIVDPADFPRLSPASGDEEDLLDLAYAATRTSRLACQIILADALDGLTVRIA
ncbi:MAG: ferredoxin [Sphingomonas bacterium]|uniref:2Fe-2S iron-sulfur cluster-binding protein n=1 Tax=Sphingomonas bacterium TaxID=1895847 RepID=UPI00262AE8D6|nr:2Fe-2S iron-sulfur cluster-binding protein [Sphingomonas bacterium]MDB5695922.1 ferredoxin [Sphingomonas bacterium]